jgi:CRP-like cAMP-binding protein
MPDREHSASIDAATLARFVPISELSDDHRAELGNHCRLQHLAEGEVLQGAPALATYLVFVLDGAVRLRGGPYPEENVEALTPGARFALAGMESTLRETRALRPSTLLMVDRAKTSTLLIWAHSTSTQPIDATRATRQQADIAALLLDSELLAQIPPSNIDRISNLVERLEVAAGDTVISQGEPGEHYYLVAEGRCEVLRTLDSGGPPVRLAELGKGSTFGEEALLTNAPRNASIRMLTSGVLLRLNRNYFLELISHPLLNVVSHERAEDLVAMGARLVDVRTTEEFEHDGLEGALNVPLGSLREHLPELPGDTSYVTYCDTGRRAQAAAFLLSQRGLVSCCLRGGISERRPGNREVHSPTEVLPELRAELARTEAALEQAIHGVAAAEAAQAVQNQRAKASERQDLAEARLRRARERAAAAQATLEQVKQHKLDLDQKVRTAEAEAASRRRHAEAQCERMRQETQALLEQEKQHLAEQYREASTRLRAVEDARAKAEAHFEAERQRLQREFEAARERIEQEANRIRLAMENARQEAESKAETLRSRHMSQEEQLRRETETALAQERTRLEAEVARSIAAQEQARQQLESTEVERREAEQEAMALREHMQQEERNRRERNQHEQQAEEQRLREEQSESAQRLEQALARRDEAEQRRAELAERVMNATMGGERQKQLMHDLEEFERDLRDADDRLDAARAAHASAQEEAEVAREVAETTPKVEEEVRLKLYEEMEEFISEEERRSAAELNETARYAAEYERIQAEKEARMRESEQATASMFDELKGILEGASEDDPFDLFIRQRMVVEEKARLVRSARVQASERTQAARDAVNTTKASSDGTEQPE